VIAKNGMVASEQELATQIGLDILKAGGNAVDAAVAVGFALAVALPNAGNIGGGGFMMVHDAKSGKDIALDFRETAPKGASRNVDSSTLPPLKKSDLVWVSDRACSYRRTFRFDPASQRYKPNAPLPACDQYSSR
jgi:gamma-glutamyltranspeptidase